MSPVASSTVPDDGTGETRPLAGAAAPVTGELGRFTITGTVGRGGMGIVLAARDAELDRRVAIKLLNPGVRGDELLAAARLEREAQAMAKLSHPNVVTVYEVGRFDGRPYIAMELVEGGTLRDWLRARRRPWREILAMLIAAGRGLAAAHAVDLVHRDFKPENVLIGGDGRPRVSDFGLVTSARAAEDAAAGEAPATVTVASALGTPAYMAPEQWERGPVDHRTDQHAFAITAWEALWGTRPFAGASRDEIRERVLAGRIDPPGGRRGVSRRIEAALRRALSVRAEDRWPTLDALLDELERRARDRRPLLAVAIAGVVGAGAVAALAARGAAPGESPCRAAGDALDAVWTDGRRDALAAGFARLGAAPAWRETAATIDGWVAEHRAVRIETCELARSGDPGVRAIAAARGACLDRRRTELDGLLATLEAPDSAIVPYARAAAHGLNRPGSCEGSPRDRLDGAPPLIDREPLDQAHRRLAIAAAQRALGKPREAVAISEEVASRADALEWPPLIAAAHLELGLDYHATRAHDAAEAAYQRAAWYAELSHDDALRFEATVGLVEMAMQGSRYEEAGRLLETARMIAQRLPPDTHRATAIAATDARLAFWRGAYLDCVDLSKKAIAAIEQAFGPEQLEAARMRVHLASCLGDLDRLDEVAAPLEQALAIADATVGRDHPLTADIFSSLGTNARKQGRPEEALRYFGEALAIRERVLGPDNPDVAAVLNNAGNALRALGRHDEARAHFERAIAIWDRAWGPGSPATAIAYNGLGEIAMTERDYRTAIAHFRRSLAIRRDKRPAGHDDIARAMVKLGGALLGARDRACVPMLEEAVASYDANPQVAVADRALARLQLGRALVELRVDPRRGRALIEAACPDLDGPAWRDQATVCRHLRP